MERWAIEKLIDKYWEGNTTLDEERELRSYFSAAEDVPEEWRPVKAMLNYFESEEPLPQEPTASKENTKSFWQKRKGAIAVAATALLLIGSTVLIRPYVVSTAEENTTLTSSDIQNTKKFFREMKKTVEQGKENLNVKKRISSLGGR